MQRDVGKFGISDKRGRHITRNDPYVAETSMKEPSICQSCHAIYHQQRWQLDPAKTEEMQNHPDVQWVTCPACLKASAHDPEGIITLRGDYLWNHEAEIRNILQNEAEKIMAKNPVARIMSISTEEDTLVIETTAQKLAEHLGRTLNRAHKGKLDINWAGSAAVCRVSWERWQ